MRMEMVDWAGDILSLVAQEASALVELLCEQNSGVLDRIFALVEPKTLDHIQSLTNTRERVSAIVDYFKSSDRNSCTRFLTTVYQYSENIPFLLETTLVSIAGYSPGTNCNHTCDTVDSSHSPNVKRPRLDHLQSYTDALKSMVLQKHESVAQAVVKDIRLEDTWVYLRHRNPPRVKDKTIQPQVSLDSHEGEESEHKVSVESLLKTTSRVVTLLGQAGSGKTLLVHCLGRDWAKGSFPSVHLLFLLEFRQLNLISRDLSLKELLFLFYPACDDDEEQRDAVFEFILSNPEKVCFIFDGYDEFRAKLTHPEKLESISDPNKPLPMTNLISGLCNRKFLSDCTVLVTCRPRDATDMFGSPGFITCELQGFDRLGVKEYAEQYFHKKGDELKKKAVNLLMNNRHLLSMSHVPGLCHICCVCMEHLFSSDGTDLQLPTSLTQIYMQILLAFLKRINGGVVSGISLLQRYRSKIVEMSQLALKGLEESTIVFMDTDVSPDTSQTGPKIVELCRCAHETQDAKLARAIGSRPQFELRNIRLNAVDLDSLAFVTAAADQNVCLDIGGCSIDPDCLEILPSFKKVDHLIFRSRKYDDKFAEALCGILCKLQALQKLDFISGGLTDVGVVKLARALKDCPHITHLNLSNNSLGNKGLKKILDLLPKLGMIQEINGDHLIIFKNNFCLSSLTHSDIKPFYMTKLCKQLVKCENLLDIEFSHLKLSKESVEKLMSILPEMSSLQLLNLSHVDLSTNEALLLIRSLADCQRVTAVELRHQAEAFIKFVPEKAEAAICKLTEYELRKSNVEKLSRILENCPRLSELDLSHNLLRDEGVKCFVDYLPKLKISSSVSLTGNQITQVGALHLVNSMNTCEKVVAVEVSLGVEDQSLIKFVQEHVNGKTLREIPVLDPLLCKFNYSIYFYAHRIWSAINIVNKYAKLIWPFLLLTELILKTSHLLCSPSGVLVFCLIVSLLLVLCFIHAFILLYSPYLMYNSTFVTFFSFDDCDIEGQHLTPLTLPIQKCHALQDLKFSQLKMDRKGADFFSAVIPFLRNLRNLTLDLKGAAEDDVATLMEALPKTTSFESLSLSQLVLGDHGTAVLGRALQSMPNLNLSQCSGWTAARGRDLVRGLVQCVSLSEIRLDSVILDEEGITILAQGFSCLTSLRRLSLNKIRVVTSETFVNGTGILYLLASFKGFRQMEEIELESWRMGDSGTCELVKYIPSWTELVKLRYGKCGNRYNEFLVGLSNDKSRLITSKI
uniref:NACHT domain-containing protein n=1 Tax=Cyprinus carpio TaxID=7962 RepID=A0A8C2JQR5_CYPCA